MKHDMKRAWIGRLACVVVLVVSALFVPYATTSAAPKSDDKSAATEKQTKARAPRLPNYYGRVSTPEQKQKLRAILREFSPQIQKKREELQALVSKRDAALAELLTPEQRQQVEKLRAEAAARRKTAARAANDGKP